VDLQYVVMRLGCSIADLQHGVKCALVIGDLFPPPMCSIMGLQFGVMRLGCVSVEMCDVVALTAKVRVEI
jgi:hypothetical protein